MSVRPDTRCWFDAAFDFSYRPATYWAQTPSEETVVNQIKGTLRRRAVAGALAERDGPPPGIAEIVLESALDDETRDAFGAIDPSLMGGEYLPDVEEESIEIARVEMRSTTFDVIRLRATRGRRSVSYAMVDEYEDIGSSWTLPRARSRRPLSFGELIDVIDGASGGFNGDAFEGILYGNLDAGVLDIYDFIEVSSPFYPKLQRYYELRSLDWLARQLTDGDISQCDPDVELRLLSHRRLALTNSAAVIDPWPYDSAPSVSRSPDPPDGSIDGLFPVRDEGSAGWRRAGGEVWLPPLPLALAQKQGIGERGIDVLRVVWEEPPEPTGSRVRWTGYNKTGFREDCPSLVVFEAVEVDDWTLLTATDEAQQTLLLAAATGADASRRLVTELLRTNGEKFAIQLLTRAPARIRASLPPKRVARLIAGAISPEALFWNTLETQLGLDEESWDGWPPDPEPRPAPEPERRIPAEEIEQKRRELRDAEPGGGNQWSIIARNQRISKALAAWQRERDPSFDRRHGKWAQRVYAWNQQRAIARSEACRRYQEWLVHHVL